jgi:hypothetical protein
MIAYVRGRLFLTGGQGEAKRRRYAGAKPAQDRGRVGSSGISSMAVRRARTDAPCRSPKIRVETRCSTSGAWAQTAWSGRRQCGQKSMASSTCPVPERAFRDDGPLGETSVSAMIFAVGRRAGMGRRHGLESRSSRERVLAALWTVHGATGLRAGAGSMSLDRPAPARRTYNSMSASGRDRDVCGW